MCPGNQSYVVRLGSKQLYLLKHLTFKTDRVLNISWNILSGNFMGRIDDIFLPLLWYNCITSNDRDLLLASYLPETIFTTA